MARFRRRAGATPAGPVEHQLTIFEKLETFARRAEAPSPARPALRLFLCVLALMALGLVLQASHASTTLDPAAYRSEVVQQTIYRLLGIGAILFFARVGPQGLRRFLPALVVLVVVALFCVWVPGVGEARNGSARWVLIPGLNRTFQPSELARIVMVLWVADRCTRLGPRLLDLRRGVGPVLATGLFVMALIGAETDLGGALLFFLCFVSTLYIGGARFWHSAGSAITVGGTALLVGVTFFDYIRRRVEVFLGVSDNAQASDAVRALGSGEWFGVGLGQGAFRNTGIPYQDSDYIFAMIGEELGLAGTLLTLGLISAFVWFSLRLVLTIRDRYLALSAFGLLLSVSVQAMLHMQVVTGLAPPKGMTLPFLSDGGTSLIVSSVAVGLALGAARRQDEDAAAETGSPDGDLSPD